MCCANDHPTPLEFKYRIRCFVLEKHSTYVFTRNHNTTGNSIEECLSKITSHDLSKSDESRTNENNERATDNMLKYIYGSDFVNDGIHLNIYNNADNNTNDSLAEQVFCKLQGELFSTVSNIIDVVMEVSIEKSNDIPWA
ncbi:hypothetical protein PR048_016530 [Dryococelus australis]|uniref:Uncharacterized protein n=1 Tax=Dryococelus australis TaxID=614101 RepID=A0ABQ9HK10_9NEOP|nr:hypothetical protein PR048_016530 [Dryococelus australis]